MATASTSLVQVIGLSGGAPDHHRTAGDIHAPALSAMVPPDATAGAETPSVVISASAIDLHIGDTLIGTIVGPDAKGQRHFIAAQGVFSVDPQSALDGLSEAKLVITRTGLSIEALVQSPPEDIASAPQPVKLQLVQSNLVPLPDLFDANALVAADNPISVAENIAIALRQVGLDLPRGFILTPTTKTPLPVAIKAASTVVRQVELLTTPVAIAAADLLDDIAPPVPMHETVATTAAITPSTTTPATKHAPALTVGLPLQLTPLAPNSADQLPLQLSLLADMPDSKAARAAIVQSPLFSALLKTGRLLVVATPANAAAPANALANLVSFSAPSLHPAAESQSATAAIRLALEDLPAQPLKLPADRLLILINTAASKPAETIQATTLTLTDDDLQLIAQLQLLGKADAYPATADAPKSLPQLKDSLPAEFILLFHAIGRKLPSPVLTRLAQARYAIAEQSLPEAPVLEALRGLARTAASTAGVAAEAQHRLVLPLQVEGQMLPLILMYTPPHQPQDEKPDHGSTRRGQEEQDFALEVDFDHMGPLRLSGRCSPTQLSLAIETRAALPISLQETAKALFFEAMAAADLSGQLNFSVGSVQGWQSPQPTL